MWYNDLTMKPHAPGKRSIRNNGRSYCALLPDFVSKCSTESCVALYMNYLFTIFARLFYGLSNDDTAASLTTQEEVLDPFGVFFFFRRVVATLLPLQCVGRLCKNKMELASWTVAVKLSYSSCRKLCGLHVGRLQPVNRYGLLFAVDHHF